MKVRVWDYEGLNGHRVTLFLSKAELDALHEMLYEGCLADLNVTSDKVLELAREMRDVLARLVL